MNKYNEEMAVRTLRSAVGVTIGHKTIGVQNGSIGIKTWGIVDFLVNHCGYKCTIEK